MGKRSSFERVPRDFYATPAKAVAPLIPYLRAGGIRAFAEPCCGDGDLVRILESNGLMCSYAGDIVTGQDALARDHYGAADAIVTNPPYRRDVLHKLIPHFGRILPTWLLLPADWVSTLQAVPYLAHCSDVVPIGRVKWFADTRHQSMENFAWLRFDARHQGATVIHRRGEAEVIRRRTAVCQQCRKPYELQRSTARFCSPACKQRAHRQRHSVTPSVTAAPSPDAVIEQTESGETFRYVLHDDVERFLADGWELLSALDGTHHAEYSALMRRRGE